MSPLALLQALDYSVLQQCMHCGMCLPVCPTYAETGKERNSPRGRIALMRAVADGDLSTTRAFADEMSYCLGCLACTSACPAGVDYAHLLEIARTHVEESAVNATRTRNLVRRLTMRWLFTRPGVLRMAGRLLWFWQRSGLDTLSRRFWLTHLLPRRLRELEPNTPRIQWRFSDELIARNEPAVGKTRHRVAMLTGCVQDLVFSDVNRATVDVLRENGCEVFTPRRQHCCGSLHAHNGDLETARFLARRQLDAIDPTKYDAIISNAGGCGSHLKHYNRLLADDPDYAGRAEVWSRKLRDILEWLVEIGFREPRNDAGGVLPVTYHEACHLCHGQKVSAQPREILRSIPGIELVELKEATWCCGSAGIYTITQPDTAARLQQRKLEHLRASGAGVVATANPGCHLHIQNGFRAADGRAPRVVHPVVLLAEAYRAERDSVSRQSN
ncbi:MAG: (Fe-S)-binding protein [Opitutaceae bacterium]|nr:(Fe-S)-binding protein [Opitutaceae bacterium]